VFLFGETSLDDPSARCASLFPPYSGLLGHSAQSMTDLSDVFPEDPLRAPFVLSFFPCSLTGDSVRYNSFLPAAVVCAIGQEPVVPGGRQARSSSPPIQCKRPQTPRPKFSSRKALV